MTTLDKKIFNTDAGNKDRISLFLGPEPGLFDTVNKQYPKIWEIYKLVKSLDWDENEFNYSSCNSDFKTCPKSVYDIMIKTLAWQWEADSIASRSISSVMGSFISSSELWAAWQRVSDQEVVHAATYSEIVRNSFDDPSKIHAEILAVKESIGRLEVVGQIMSHAYKKSHEYALGQVPNDQETYNAAFMFTVAMLVLERLQFMSSFAVTFAICDTGLFQPIGKAVQKIAQDELEGHVALDMAILENELQTERGRIAFQQNQQVIQKLIDDVLSAEFRWVDYLFSDGRELVGMNATMLKKWSCFMARGVYEFFGLQSATEIPKKNPLKFMENWLDISRTQPSPQEQDNGQYKVGIMRRDDETEEFDVDF